MVVLLRCARAIQGGGQVFERAQLCEPQDGVKKPNNGGPFSTARTKLYKWLHKASQTAGLLSADGLKAVSTPSAMISRSQKFRRLQPDLKAGQ